MDARTPPLIEAHHDRGAKFTEFGGWEMPVEFDSIREEHTAVREAAGVFDVSHMGQIEVTGPEAGELTDRLVTNDVGALAVGDSCYAMIVDENGVMLDDTVVYRRGEERYLFVPNAGHDAEIHDRWVTYRDEWGLDARVENATEAYAMLAIQGPEAPGIVADVAAGPVLELGRFEATETTVAGVDAWVARTGYTGEDGFEAIVEVTDAEPVWEAVVSECQPCGLGARDTLRTEMGFLLSGQDFHPEENPRNPYEADHGFTVKLGKDRPFVGREALERAHEAGVEETFVGFVLEDRGVPRHGYDIATPDGEPVGTVTSGTMSPTLGEPIGLGYVPTEYAEPGTELRVVIREQPKRAKIRSLPFLDR